MEPEQKALEQARLELELPRRFSLADVRRAYRRLARRWHPDRAGDAERMQRVAAAHKRLIGFLEELPRAWDRDLEHAGTPEQRLTARFGPDWLQVGPGSRPHTRRGRRA